MKKTQVIIALLLAFTATKAQTDTLFTRNMNGILASIHQIDSSANLVKHQCFWFSQNRIRLNYYSSTDKRVHHKAVVRYRNNKVYARHIYKTGYSTLIRISTIDDAPIFITRRNTFEKIRHVVTFTYLGNSKWYFNYKVGDDTKKYFFTRDIGPWR